MRASIATVTLSDFSSSTSVAHVRDLPRKRGAAGEMNTGAKDFHMNVNRAPSHLSSSLNELRQGRVEKKRYWPTLCYRVGC
jgi:hypothetical protein